jgi:outer membrane murein-binding lipoprotein Lpp
VLPEKLRPPKRALAIAALALSAAFLTGCETSKDSESLADFVDLTDAEIEQLEQEIESLPENSVLLKVLSNCLYINR